MMHRKIENIASQRLQIKSLAVEHSELYPKNIKIDFSYAQFTPFVDQDLTLYVPT